MNQQSSVPMVSVLIRTMGRTTLAGAIASVRAQTFADWEILVLDAGDEPIPDLSQVLAGARSRVIEPGGRVDRARAANLLLDAARGRYALFLDDDDWLMPDHLAKLADTLQREPSLVAAYGDVVVLAQARQPGEHAVHTFAADFDATALQLQNYLPIHAVMFRLAQVRGAAPIRFDESMALFEDWDFWVQLAARGPFQRVPGVSAAYALDAALGSGHASRGPGRAGMLEAMARRQLARWTPADVVRLIERDVRRDSELNQAAQQLAAEREAVASLRTESQRLQVSLAELQRLQASLAESQKWGASLELEVGRHIASLEKQAAEIASQTSTLSLQQAELALLARVREDLLAQIRDIQASASWRITRPLRYAGGLARGVTRRMRLGMGMLRTATGELRRHGPRGFAARLPYYVRQRRAYIARFAGTPAASPINPFGAVTAQARREMRLHPDIDDEIVPVDARVSVVIPTFNAGPEFQWLLRKLNAQKAVAGVEIVVVDSGSRDTTVAMAQAAGARVVEIPQSEFTHSHSRNLGAETATGDYVLFMVQDAYPIGDHWMNGMLRALRDPAHARLAAVSCSEFARSDSDVMYDAMIDTHYRFLGCLEQDRVGTHTGDDHMSLRSQGQLSDVSCLISRDLFNRYRYRGDYAEDLDLGIRLIKDGWQVAMLASVKTIHSHNRPAYYYLKRSFVDVEFLVGLFDDFAYPHCDSLPGLAQGIASCAAHVSDWTAEIANAHGDVTGARLKEWTVRWRRDLARMRGVERALLGDERLEAFVAELSSTVGLPLPGDPAATAEARRFGDAFCDRLDHVARYISGVYDDADPLPAQEVAAVVRKTFAAAAGSLLAFYFLDHRQEGAPGREQAQWLHDTLTAGV